jgi:hypothetical protein
MLFCEPGQIVIVVPNTPQCLCRENALTTRKFPRANRVAYIPDFRGAEYDRIIYPVSLSSSDVD